uniref:Uncharacterized protein LOC114337456 isoform X7 n=1 Tax=Diabrotica virgifera virgifera TaxID=50390 RepID=A0A6P7GA29_DIAVI
MEVKQEVVEDTCKIEIVDIELDDSFIDICKNEIKAEPKTNSTPETVDDLVLNEFPVKSEIEDENQKDGRDICKNEIKAEPKTNSTPETVDNLVLNEFPVKSEIEDENKKPFEENQKDGRDFIEEEISLKVMETISS